MNAKNVIKLSKMATNTIIEKGVTNSQKQLYFWPPK